MCRGLDAAHIQPAVRALPAGSYTGRGGRQCRIQLEGHIWQAIGRQHQVPCTGGGRHGCHLQRSSPLALVLLRARPHEDCGCRIPCSISPRSEQMSDDTGSGQTTLQVYSVMAVQDQDGNSSSSLDEVDSPAAAAPVLPSLVSTWRPHLWRP